MLAVKGDMAEGHPDVSFSPIEDVLQDCDDDVRADAAEELLPVVRDAFEGMYSRVPRPLSNLWEELMGEGSLQFLWNSCVSHW